MQLRSCKLNIFLVGDVSHQIAGFKLPSIRQVLSVLFYNIREVKLTVSESANLAIRECNIFWEKARIPTRSLPNSVKQLVKLYDVWRNLQKDAKKTQEIYEQRRKEFTSQLDNLFDIAHADSLKLISVEEDKIFLQRQREPGRPGYLAGVDKQLTGKDERRRQRALEEENRRLKYYNTASTSAAYDFTNFNIDDEFDDSSSSSDVTTSYQQMTTLTESEKSGNTAKRGRKNFVTPKLVATLDRCQLSIRDSVFILQAALEALGHDIDDFSINKSSIHRIRMKIRKEQAEAIKIDFKNKVPEVVTLHWDGKLLPALDARSTKEERLPIVISFGNEDQLIAVPKLDNSSGKEQAQAVWNAITNWNLEDKVQILCCDTTASNTGRINGACVLLEQKFDRDLLIFACRHHVYELVLKSVFDVKMQEVTTGPDIPIFKRFQENYKNLDRNKIQCSREILEAHFSHFEIESLIHFYEAKLKGEFVRDDYRELVELSILFMGGDADRRELKIRPPGAMHRARWMARAIYSLKISLLSSQFILTKKEKAALQDVCVFIVTSYIKPWLQCCSAIKAPYQDLTFIKSLKAYENVDENISKTALQKFSNHLWYLTDEAAVLSLFDDEVDQETKCRMVRNLLKEEQRTFGKRYIPSESGHSGSLYSKCLILIY